MWQGRLAFLYSLFGSPSHVLEQNGKEKVQKE